MTTHTSGLVWAVLRKNKWDATTLREALQNRGHDVPISLVKRWTLGEEQRKYRQPDESACEHLQALYDE